jgi:hypothetical protein
MAMHIWIFCGVFSFFEIDMDCKQSSIPSAGLGNFASENYVKGDIIAQEGAFYSTYKYLSLEESKIDLTWCATQELLSYLHREDSKIGKQKTEKLRKVLNSLVSHRCGWKPDEEEEKLSKKIASMLGLSQEYVLTCHLRVLRNHFRFGILTSDMHAIYGVALFEKFSRLNHSCKPNATIVEMNLSDDGILFGKLQALRDIRAGEEICIRYGAHNTLMEDHGFECKECQ